MNETWKEKRKLFLKESREEGYCGHLNCYIIIRATPALLALYFQLISKLLLLAFFVFHPFLRNSLTTLNKKSRLFDILAPRSVSSSDSSVPSLLRFNMSCFLALYFSWFFICLFLLNYYCVFVLKGSPLVDFLDELLLLKSFFSSCLGWNWLIHNKAQPFILKLQSWKYLVSFDNFLRAFTISCLNISCFVFLICVW